MDGKDNINVEYEARVMINKNQYSQIKKEYLDSGIRYQEVTNTNYYFDDENLALTNQGIVLRLRQINKSKNNELTLKIKGDKGDKEINHQLTSKEAKLLVDKNVFPKSNVLDELIKRNINIKSLKLITSLTTDRLEFYYSDYIFVIDKNEYKNKVDYNIEVESSSKKAAETYLKQIILKFNIKYKKDYISKSRRAIYNL